MSQKVGKCGRTVRVPIIDEAVEECGDQEEARLCLEAKEESLRTKNELGQGNPVSAGQRSQRNETARIMSEGRESWTRRLEVGGEEGSWVCCQGRGDQQAEG